MLSQSCQQETHSLPPQLFTGLDHDCSQSGVQVLDKTKPLMDDHKINQEFHPSKGQASKMLIDFAIEKSEKINWKHRVAGDAIIFDLSSSFSENEVNSHVQNACFLRDKSFPTKVIYRANQCVLFDHCYHIGQGNVFPEYNLKDNLLTLEWKTAKYVGRNFVTNKKIVAKQLTANQLQNRRVELLHAEAGQAIISRSSSTQLATTYVEVCHVLVLHDHMEGCTCLAHCFPSQITNDRLDKFLDLLESNGFKFESTTARVIGGHTIDIGTQRYFLDVILPVLTKRNIEIVQAFIGNPSARPIHIIFDVETNNLLGFDCNQELNEKFKASHREIVKAPFYTRLYSNDDVSIVEHSVNLTAL